MEICTETPLKEAKHGAATQVKAPYVETGEGLERIGILNVEVRQVGIAPAIRSVRIARICNGVIDAVGFISISLPKEDIGVEEGNSITNRSRSNY